MEKRGLVVGIDYTSEYCQACYYNSRHKRTESVTSTFGAMRYLIATAICYSTEKEMWLIGDEAASYAEKTGAYLFQDLLDNVKHGEKCYINDKEYTYVQLLAIYMGKLLELVQVRSATSGIENITINLRRVDMETKEIFRQVFGILNIDISKVRLLSCAESFAYFLMNESPELRARGAALFDFSGLGLSLLRLHVEGTTQENLRIYVNEKNYYNQFYTRDLGSELQRMQLDNKLNDIYSEIKETEAPSSVYFTGDGFSQLWFSATLMHVSEESRAFKGNNLYVKGACLAGVRRAAGRKDYPIICKGRTKASIHLSSIYQGKIIEMELSRAACDWYDAGVVADFIMGDDKRADFFITSLISNERTKVSFDLSSFPDRPSLMTRVEVSVRYYNEFECEIRIRDKGFGDFYPASGAEVAKKLNLEGYI